MAIGSTAGSSAAGDWYAREVPDIVTGLEATGMISAATAARARRLIDDDRPVEALSVSLAAADGEE